MRGRARMLVVVIIALIVIVMLPIVVCYLLSQAIVTTYLNQILTEPNSNFLQICVGYLSLATTLLLGVVVYFQSNRINDLEVAQYSSFLGILDVDYTVDLDNCIYVPNGQKGFIISYHFADKNKSMLSSVDFSGGGQVKSVVLPLVFTTKNQQLITSIHYKSVEVALRFAGTEIARRKFESKSGPIYALLDNESKFSLGFGMLMPDDWNADEVELHFSVCLKDQNGVNKQLEIVATLQKNGSGKGYCIVASRTIESPKSILKSKR